LADSIYKWSLTAASNDAADSIINWRENQLPDTVNDSNRAMMKRIAEWREDMTGGLVTAGTQPAYTLTTNAAFDTLTNGRFITVRIHATNAGGASTLNVNVLGAKAIRKFGTSGDLPLAIGDLQLGGLYTFMYSTLANAGAGAWVISNPSSGPSGSLASGTSMLFLQASAPLGWTKQTTYNDRGLRIVSGTGGGAGGSVAFTTVFNSTRTLTGSVDAIALTAAQLPAHTHTQNGTFGSGINSVGHTHTFSDASSTTGGVSANHTHVANNGQAFVTFLGGAGGQGTTGGGYSTASATGANSVGHTHTVAVSGTTSGVSANHTHNTTISGETGSIGGNTTHTHTFTGNAPDLQYVDAIICNKD